MGWYKLFTYVLSAPVVCLAISFPVLGEEANLSKSTDNFLNTYTPNFRTRSSAELWAERSYEQLTEPPLGETAQIERELGGRIRVVEGVNYNLPAPPSTLDTSGLYAKDLYEANRVIIRSRLDEDGFAAASVFFASTQLPRGEWDYKYKITGAGTLGSDIGYAAGAYAAEPIFSKEQVLLGFGIFRNLNEIWKKTYDFHGMNAYFNKPRGYIFASMGYEYAASRQYINDFIDAANFRDLDPLDRRIAELRATLRLSSDEEFSRRALKMGIIKPSNQAEIRIMYEEEKRKQREEASRKAAEKAKKDKATRERERRNREGPQIPDNDREPRNNDEGSAHQGPSGSSERSNDRAPEIRLTNP